MAYIHMYNNNPTSGGTDGNLVSELLPFTGSTVSGNAVVSGTSINTALLTVGQPITGAGIPAGTTIDSIISASSFELSANATTTNDYVLMAQGNLITTNFLNASTSDVSSPIKLALRCDIGYNSVSTTTVTPTPVLSFTANTSSGSNVVTGSSVNTINLGVGQYVTGTGIQAGTKIASITSSTSFTLSLNATANQTGVTLGMGDASKWALAPDNSGSPGTFEPYGNALNINDVIGTTNYIIWARARATSDETPINDLTISLRTLAQIQAV